MHHQVEEIMYTFWIAVLLIAACNSSLLIDSLMTSEPSEIPTQTDVRMRALAAGEFRLPAASAFGEKGFHEVLVATHTVPQDLRSTTGMKFVISLWDAGRPGQTCIRHHPLSGCATVDWSDAEGRPKVPPGGVFENSITLQLASGTRKFFLSESEKLADAPDAFKPG
jgi:hypothetical protein